MRTLYKIPLMNRYLTTAFFFILFISLLLSQACKKKTEDAPVAGPVPVLTTTAFSNVLLSTAKLSGNITSDGGTFVTKRGFCWSSSTQNPTIQNDTIVSGNGAGFYSGTIKGLKGQTTYYVRAFAINSNGTGYGSILNMATLDSTITDIENNHYRIIQIGMQVWMAENLKTTKYRNGENITNVTTASGWNQAKTGAYCNYDNSGNLHTIYGSLYNFYAIADTRNIAPAGWHVPGNTEWDLMINLIGGKTVAGGKLKETGSAHWQSPNMGATNETGFTALPGGCRDDQGVFTAINEGGAWWMSTTSGSYLAWFCQMNKDDATFFSIAWLEGFGFSVRCVRD